MRTAEFFRTTAFRPVFKEKRRIGGQPIRRSSQLVPSFKSGQEECSRPDRFGQEAEERPERAKN